MAANNAGAEGQPGTVSGPSAENHRSTFDANVPGALPALKHEMRAMLKQGAGAIVNLSSVAGQVGIAAGLGVRGQQACRRRADEECGP